MVSHRCWASLFSLKILSKNLGCSCELLVVSLGASTGMLFYPRVSDFHSIILMYIKSLPEKLIWSTEINALKYLLKSFLQFCLYWVFTKPLHTLQNFLHTLLCTGLRNKKKKIQVLPGGTRVKEVELRIQSSHVKWLRVCLQ